MSFHLSHPVAIATVEVQPFNLKRSEDCWHLHGVTGGKRNNSAFQKNRRSNTLSKDEATSQFSAKKRD